MRLSVLIPTYNRADALDRCLASLAAQRVDAEWEVVLVDDGSTDKTATVLERHRKSFPAPLTFHRQENRGPAAARNLALARSRGEIVLFIGDDIVPEGEDFLACHLDWHATRCAEPQLAVLGLTTWADSVRVTAYMRWLEGGGPQFAYGDLTHGEPADYRFLYTSNISLKRAFLGEDRFDERFPWAAWEDVELGYRLGKRGLRVVYHSGARAGHLHEISLTGYLRRAFVGGQAAALLGQIHPELAERHPRLYARPRPGLLKTLLLNPVTIPVLTLLARAAERRFILPNLYASLYAYHHRRGLRVGWAEPRRS